MSTRATREPALSPRLAAIVDALPLRPGLRVLEIGCGPGTAARAVARRIGDGHVLAIDRSATARSSERSSTRSGRTPCRSSRTRRAPRACAGRAARHVVSSRSAHRTVRRAP